jgi:hypothetical protein
MLPLQSADMSAHSKIADTIAHIAWRLRTDRPYNYNGSVLVVEARLLTRALSTYPSLD